MQQYEYDKLVTLGCLLSPFIYYHIQILTCKIRPSFVDGFPCTHTQEASIVEDLRPHDYYGQ